MHTILGLEERSVITVSWQVLAKPSEPGRFLYFFFTYFNFLQWSYFSAWLAEWIVLRLQLFSVVSGKDVHVGLVLILVLLVFTVLSHFLSPFCNFCGFLLSICLHICLPIFQPFYVCLTACIAIPLSVSLFFFFYLWLPTWASLSLSFYLVFSLSLSGCRY